MNSGPFGNRAAALREKAARAKAAIRATYREQWQIINREYSNNRLTGSQHAAMEDALFQERDAALAAVDVALEQALARL